MNPTSNAWSPLTAGKTPHLGVLYCRFRKVSAPMWERGDAGLRTLMQAVVPDQGGLHGKTSLFWKPGHKAGDTFFKPTIG